MGNGHSNVEIIFCCLGRMLSSPFAGYEFIDPVFSTIASRFSSEDVCFVGVLGF